MVENEKSRNLNLPKAFVKYVEDVAGELGQGAEDAFLTIPIGFRDWTTVRIAEYYLQFGERHGFKTNDARGWGKKIMECWYQGKPSPLSEFAEGLFEGWKFNFRGVDSLEKDKAEIFVVNQPNTGPLRGNWFKFLVNNAVATQRGRLGKYEARWVQKEISEKPIFQKTPIGIQKRRLSRMINRSCGTILINPDGQGRENVRAVLEMRRHLQDRGVLVVCPEGQDNKVLGRGRGDAGELLSLLVGKLGVAVRPVGVWDYKEDLNVSFGEPLDPQVFRDSSQRIADLSMVEVAKLLPEEKRGVYSKLAASSLKG